MTTTAMYEAVVRKNNVHLSGNENGRPLVFVHGFGCSQEMWRKIVPTFSDDYKIVLFDLVGAGGSDLSAYDPSRYDSLYGYADDLVDLLEALDLTDAVVVGHSVSGMISAIAASRSPERFGALALVGPSPRYVNEGDYIGGFTKDDIASLLDSLDANYLGWSEHMSHVIMGNDDRPELAEEWNDSFCRTDPTIARHFARVTFLSDNRRDLAAVATPTLIIQASDDHVAPPEVGAFVHSQIRGSEFVMITASGHSPHLSDPDLVIGAIQDFLR